MSALQRTSSTHAENLQDLARQAQSQGKATIVTMNGKQYAIINITRDSTFGEVPSGEKAQKLAQQIIGAHQTQPPSLAGKEITHIDSKGAHYEDGTFTSHTDVKIDQKTFHQTTIGLMESQIYTPSQAAIISLADTVRGQKDNLTKETVIRLLEDPNLPQEFKTEISKLIASSSTEKIDFKEFVLAFNKAYFGNKIGSQYFDKDTSERPQLFQRNGDEIQGYLGRLRDDHLKGIAPEKHDAFKTSFKQILADNPKLEAALTSINAATATGCTAQHAWNALESLVPKTQGVAKLVIVPLDPLQVPVSSNPPPLYSPPVETGEQLQVRAEEKGLLTGMDETAKSRLSENDLKRMLVEEEIACILGVKEADEKLSCPEITQRYPAFRQKLNEEARGLGIENPSRFNIQELFMLVEEAKLSPSPSQPVLSERSQKIKEAFIQLAALKGLFGKKTQQQIENYSIEDLRRMVACERFACIMQLKKPEDKLSYGEITGLISRNKVRILEQLSEMNITHNNPQSDQEWDESIREVLTKTEKHSLYTGILTE